MGKKDSPGNKSDGGDDHHIMTMKRLGSLEASQGKLMAGIEAIKKKLDEDDEKKVEEKKVEEKKVKESNATGGNDNDEEEEKEEEGSAQANDGEKKIEEEKDNEDVVA